MFELIKSEDRGFADHGWLKAKHTFSFANYYNPDFMGFRDLRVINQDIVSPSMGFATHPHNDMEIITYVIHGRIRHKDSMGNDYEINAGELQVMSAGTGIRHSEFNASNDDHLELLQIWVLTDKAGHTPRYDQFKFTREEKLNTLKLVAAPYDHKPEPNTSPALKIHQDVKLYASILEKDHELNFDLETNRYGWIQLISGELTIKSKTQETMPVTVKAGDGLMIDKSEHLNINAQYESEFLFFDLN